MPSHLAKKSLIYTLEFLGLYTLVFIIIGLFHLTFARISPEILGNKEYPVILSRQKDNPFLLAVILVAFSALTLGLSFAYKNNKSQAEREGKF